MVRGDESACKLNAFELTHSTGVRARDSDEDPICLWSNIAKFRDVSKSYRWDT